MYMYVSRQERIRTGGRSYAPVLMRSWSRLYCLKKIITLQSDDNSCVLMVVGNFVNANIHDQSLTNLKQTLYTPIFDISVIFFGLLPVHLTYMYTLPSPSQWQMAP